MASRLSGRRRNRRGIGDTAQHTAPEVVVGRSVVPDEPLDVVTIRARGPEAVRRAGRVTVSTVREDERPGPAIDRAGGGCSRISRCSRIPVRRSAIRISGGISRIKRLPVIGGRGTPAGAAPARPVVRIAPVFLMPRHLDAVEHNLVRPGRADLRERGPQDGMPATTCRHASRSRPASSALRSGTPTARTRATLRRHPSRRRAAASASAGTRPSSPGIARSAHRAPPDRDPQARSRTASCCGRCVTQWSTSSRSAST